MTEVLEVVECMKSGGFSLDDSALRQALNALELDGILLMEIKKKFSEKFVSCLKGNEKRFDYSPMMFPTYVGSLPNGKERGMFYAIDLGGTNLRFFSIELTNKEMISNYDLFHVPKSVMNGTADELFGFIAENIGASFKSRDIKQPIEYLGFTFSFPTYQKSLTSASLIKWTKGYTTSGVVGQDVCVLLAKECLKRMIDIKNFTVINDTTGTLLAGAIQHGISHIGVINGTGTNACYIEEATNVNKLPPDFDSSRIIINTEWGAFGEEGSLTDILTFADKLVDQESPNPGRQIFEKMVSGMYLGEIVRLFLVELAKNSTIFLRRIPRKLVKKNSFGTDMISLSYFRKKFEAKFRKMYRYKINAYEYKIISEICDNISRRSANLMATGLAALMERIDTNDYTISADGSVFEHHPRYIQYVTATLSLLLPKEKSFKILLTTDGSGKGAALAACVSLHSKLNI